MGNFAHRLQLRILQSSSAYTFIGGTGQFHLNNLIFQCPHVYGFPYTMDHQAEYLLRSIVEEQTRTPWPALYLLAIHAHRYAREISGSLLSSQLIAQGFPSQQAERFGEEFDHYRELLTKYDRSQF
jgi:hypothetical protein